MLPDNTDDYEMGEDGFDLDEADGPQALLWNLLVLINPGDEDTALRQFDALREATGGVFELGEGLLWPLKDAIDWTSGFYVDAGDSETLIDCLDQLAARWNLVIDWGGDRDDEDFLGGSEVSGLLAVAYDRLREHGYTLWTWDAGSDAHAGWIALSRDDDGMRALAHTLGFELRPGSDAFL